MSERQTQVKHHDLLVEVISKPDQDIKNHIEKTVLGVPGGMLYKLVDSVERLGELKRPFFMTLRKGHRLLGSVCLAQRVVRTGHSDLSAYYIRYFSIFAPMKATRKRQLKKKAREQDLFTKHSVIKEKVAEFFNNMKQLNDPAWASGMETISYAYIEDTNFRSMDFSSLLGYETVGQFETLLFSRFFPRKDPHVFMIEAHEKEDILEGLKHQYTDHTLFFTDHLFYRDRYYVFKKNGEIKAGIQVNPVKWEVLLIPGPGGWIIQNIIPRLPVLSRVFPHGQFRFLALEGIYFQPGCEKYIIKLVESLMHDMGIYTAIAWLDKSSPVFEDLSRLGGGGLMRLAKKTMPVNIRMKFFDMSEAERRVYRDHPTYISAFDMI
jgi:hypothetical protein